MKNEKYDFIVIGSGLAGMTISYKLIKLNKKVLLIEKEKFLGGRTSSWNDEGFCVESGFHRHIGYYKKLPKLLKEVGVKLNDIVVWEKETEIILSKDSKIVLGISPIHNPITFIKDILGNKELLNYKDKISLIKLFMIGFFDYTFNSKKLDQYSILDYCKIHNIRKNIIDYIVTSLSTGIFFLPKKEYSAKLFFGLFYPSLFHIISLRIGAYNGGMSDVLINPIAKEFKNLGGVIKKETEVRSLIEKDNKIIGVKTNENIYADYTILATDLGNAKKILSNLNNNKKELILNIPETSALTVQINLKEKIMPLDRTTFAPFSILTSFTEESRTTFKTNKGRLSIIIGNPDKYIDLSDKEIINLVIAYALKIGLNLKKYMLDYRIIRHKNKFYKFSFGNDSKRVENDISIEGLLIAGDYTKQKMYATMEGAVISGLNCYNMIKKKMK